MMLSQLMIENRSMDLTEIDPTESFGLDGLAHFQQDGLLDVPSIGDIPGMSGIEASDMGSLLKQFEEASQSLGDSEVAPPSLNSNPECRQTRIISNNSTSQDAADFLTNEDEENTVPSKDVLDKIRAGAKRKSTIMLPMGMPSKRGRGRAMAMPANCAPLKLQRIMVQNLPSNSSTTAGKNGAPASFRGVSLLPANLASVKAPGNNERISADKDSRILNEADKDASLNSDKVKEIFEVNDSYFDGIIDHDYCLNVPLKKTDTEGQSLLSPEEGSQVVCNSDDTEPYVLSENGRDEDIDELLEKSVGSDLKQKPAVGSVALSETRKNKCSAFIEILKRTKNTNRNYRKHATDTTEPEEERYFDKIPAYYTALSIPNKPARRAREVSNKKAVGVGQGITVEDYFERNPSPPRDPSVYNKLPAYYSCFTNSTRYDSSEAQSHGSEKGASVESSQDSVKVCSSGYSSRSHTPSLIIDSRRCSRSPSVPSSRSRSRSRSHSRSRSRETARSTRKRSWRHERRGSYSSDSGPSSRSPSSSRSRSRSRSGSRSSSSGYSCLSRSRSRSTSPVSRSHSREGSYSSHLSPTRQKRRKQQKDLREKEKNRQIEERRIMYVGRIPSEFTRRDMRNRFERFGDIEHVQLHFREHGDNYGFVTFAYTCDAYAAIEKGNDIPGEPHFDLCFGGRRQFCETEYEDLDGDMEIIEEFNPLQAYNKPVDFDELLKQAKQKLGQASNS